MKLSILTLILTLGFSATISAETANEIVLKKREIVTTSKFHGLTYKCQLEEDEEIQSTPGSPPLDVDDPSTPGCNAWEINIVMDGDLTRSENIYELPLFDINYGIGDNLQLKYEVPYSVPDSGNPGFGDTKLGVKFQFYGNEVSKLQMAVYPQLLIRTPGKGPGFSDAGSAGNIVTLPFLFAKRLTKVSRGDIMLTGNLGYNISSRNDTQDFISSAVGIGAPLIGQSAILMEVVTEQALRRKLGDPRQQVVKLDFAVTDPLSKHLQIFGLMGHSLEASDKLNHTYVLSGFRWLVSGS